MKLVQTLKILIVSLTLIAPGLVFVLTGPVPGFEQKTQTEFPGIASVALPAPEYRRQLSDAIFERSAAKRFAIQFMNALQLYGLGYIDNAGVISGTGRWLFYKPQFLAWDCRRHDDLRRKLDRFTLIHDLVAAAEIPLVFAVAPNKASIEREHMGGRTARYMDCYFEFEQQFTAAMSRFSSNHIVDHSEVLSHLPGERPTYLKFDTHWKQDSAVEAMNQLFESRPGVLGIPLYEPGIVYEQAHMDILNLMLLLEDKSFMPVPVSITPSEEEIKAAQLASNVLFIHDSFYGRILRYLEDRSPNARFLLPLASDGLQVREGLDNADVVVVELIQRDFLDFIWSDSIFGWGSNFAGWLLGEMGKAAQQCNWTVSENPLSSGQVTIRNVGVQEDSQGMSGSRKSRVLFQIPNGMTEGRVCLRLQIETAKPGALKLYFSAPGASKKRPGYTGARMVSKTMEKGANTLALVLPESFRGQWIRIDPLDHDGEFAIHKLEFTSFD